MSVLAAAQLRLMVAVEGTAHLSHARGQPDHCSAKSLLIQENPGQSGPCYGQGAACQVFLTRPGRVNAEIRPDE